MISPGLFRLLLASVVVVSHFSKLDIGPAAVNLFFCLSGFWIYRMFTVKYSKAAEPIALFIASRLLRLLPIFLLFNIIMNLFHFFLRDQVYAKQSFASAVPNLFILGYATMAERPLTPAWSLDVELQFYLVFPILVSFLPSIRRLEAIVLGLLFLGGGIYISFFLNQDGAGNVLPYGGFFLAGVMASERDWKPPNWLTWICAAVGGGGFATLVAVPALRGFVMPGLDPAQFAWNQGLNYVVALLFVPVALMTVHAASSRRDRLLGDLSFIVYCSHWVAVVISIEYLHDLSRAQKAPLVIFMIAVCYLVSMLLLIYVDRPISRWRERWVGSHLTGGVEGADRMARSHRA